VLRARLLSVTLSAIALAITASGCGEEDGSTPAACRDGGGAYVGALGDAPGEVLLSGETPISECLTENQGGGQLETVGAAMLDAATELNTEARSEPGGPANLELGYLVGAAERGAEDTSGIHDELVRRLGAAALYSPAGEALPPRFREAYRRGVEAGRERG
jgi:hypothetical protein